MLDFGQCHDNRAFQYHNNNKLLPRPGGSGKSQSIHNNNSTMAVALDALEVVIVHKQSTLVSNGPMPSRCIAGQDQAQNRNLNHNHNHNQCRSRCRNRDCCHRRKRHNATQTSVERCCCASCHCHVASQHHHLCHHHHCHHHHHHHHDHYSSNKKRRQRRHQHQQQHQQHLQPHSKRSPLPIGKMPQITDNNNLHHNKSSLDSSELMQLPHMHSAAIAIEIDAATVTENNSSTATSNFPFKVASEGGGAPMNLKPLCDQLRQRRRGSINSNTTIETDELSRDEDDDVADDDDDEDDDDDADVRLGQQPDDEVQLTPALSGVRSNSSSSSTARALAGAAPVRNECVRIKRKRFVPDAINDYCSSCSRCSSCSCEQTRTSSCSSLDDDQRHELTVAAECHRCMAEQQSSEQLGVSRRSSLKSFCSCNTNSCCCDRYNDEGNDDEDDYVGDEDEDDEDETTGQRESFCTAADHTIVSTPMQEDAHSSTLTPLSTQEPTMRSDLGDNDDDVITDADASSLSQSAEYFSLSSTMGGVQSAASAAPAEEQQPHGSNSGASSSTNKPWSKHIRLKRSNSPLDSHL